MMGSTKEQTFAWNPVSKRQSQSDSMEAPRNMLVEPPVRDYSPLSVNRRLRRFVHVGIADLITVIG